MVLEVLSRVKKSVWITLGVMIVLGAITGIVVTVVNKQKADRLEAEAELKRSRQVETDERDVSDSIQSTKDTRSDLSKLSDLLDGVAKSSQ